MKSLNEFRFHVEKGVHSGQRLARRTSRAIYATLIFLIAFGISAIAGASQKLKRIVRAKRTALKSSYATYLTAKAWGYFKPSWSDSSTEMDLPPPLISQSDIVGDPERRIEPEFRVPRVLKGRVGFWMDVYGRFTNQWRIVHDRENPEIVYGFIDLRLIYRIFPAALADSKAEQLEKRILEELKERIADAAGIRPSVNTQFSSEESESIKRFLSKVKVRDTYEVKALIGRVRTQTGQRNFFLQAIARSRNLLPQIETIFRESGLPMTLSRLPFVESSFNPKAVSKSGAIGMWQFMPDTSRLYNRRGSRRDWSDPIRQSKNAARMFHMLKDKLGDWGIAVTAYNSGPARLKRIVNEHGVNDIEELLELPSGADTLGFAGRNFYCELLAAALVEAYQEKVFLSSELNLLNNYSARAIQPFARRPSLSPRPVKRTKPKDWATKSRPSNWNSFSRSNSRPPSGARLSHQLGSRQRRGR